MKVFSRIIVHSIVDVVLASFQFLFSTSQTWFLVMHIFLKHSEQLSGTAVAVKRQFCTILIKNGPVPDLAPCHISTEQRTHSQIQILAAGYFLAVGISCPAHTNVHNTAQTHAYTHGHTDVHK